jgi:ABC-2 type transport system ATP-binding protein
MPFGPFAGEFITRRIHRLMNRRPAGHRPESRGGDRVTFVQGVEGPGSHAPVPAEAALGAAAVRAVDLVKTFGAIRAVDGISFDLAPGRIYGLLGPNGSGKTTLIRLLTGMARPTSGHAEVLGAIMPSRPTLARIGYMTQADGIYPTLTVGENARFFAAMYGVRDRETIVEALRLVDLADREATVAGSLSGGQRRRLSLACALVHRPPVIFLDEPTVGIDPLLRAEFWAHFRSLAAAGATIAVSSHVMDEADRCDELLFVRSGRVIARGASGEIRAQAGTASLEEAFLRLGGDVEATR